MGYLFSNISLYDFHLPFPIPRSRGHGSIVAGRITEQLLNVLCLIGGRNICRYALAGGLSDGLKR